MMNLVLKMMNLALKMMDLAKEDLLGVDAGGRARSQTGAEEAAHLLTSKSFKNVMSGAKQSLSWALVTIVGDQSALKIAKADAGSHASNPTHTLL